MPFQICHFVTQLKLVVSNGNSLHFSVQSLMLYLSLAQSAYIVAYSELKLRTLAVGPGG